MKWLWIIVDEDLLFGHHWKSRILKARKLLGALSRAGSGNWGISPESWWQLYTGMVRVVAMWGMEGVEGLEDGDGEAVVPRSKDNRGSTRKQCGEGK